MYRLTDRRKDAALDILDRHTKCLHDNRFMQVDVLEHELRKLWRLGYQSLKDIMIDMLKNHSEYAHLSAYYMENSNATGVVVEFQRPLAELYGLKTWHYDDAKERKRKEFWDNAFAAISRFNLDGQSILQIGSSVQTKLIEYFLKHPNDLRTMDSRHFEELVAELFNGFGYAVELTASTRDDGRDVIAIGNELVAKSKFLIECKRYKESNKVDIQPVRSLHGVVVDERATKGLIVTTSTFTSPALKFLKRNEWTLEGRDFDGILQWLKKYQQLNFPNTDIAGS